MLEGVIAGRVLITPSVNYLRVILADGAIVLIVSPALSRSFTIVSVQVHTRM